MIKQITFLQWNVLYTEKPSNIIKLLRELKPDVVANSYTVKNISKILNHAGPKFDTKTWATKPFSYQGLEESELNWRLDYVFASKDVRIISSKVVQTDYSDHLPILTKFNFISAK